MKKSQAIALFGGTHQKLADAIGITRPAVTQWPEDLSQEQEDRVIGAAVRLGLWRCAKGKRSPALQEQA